MRTILASLILGLSLACGNHSTDSTSVAEPNPSSPPLPLLTTGDESLIPEELAVPENLVNPGKTGPFRVQSYTQGLANPAYRSAIVFYPADATARRFPATTLSGGYGNPKEYMLWLGKHLASHGIITLVFTPTNMRSFDANVWSRGHLGSLDQLEREDKRSGSPLAGRVKTDRLGVMGFSMGGAGTVLAVNKAGSRVKAAVPLCPYQPAVLKAPVPMLSMTGTRDTVAPPAAVARAFNAAKTGQPKAFAKFNGMTHQAVVINGSHREWLARYATAWYRVFLADEPAYKTYLNGEQLDEHRQGTAVFAQPQDYSYQE